MPASSQDAVTTIEELLALPEDGLRHEMLDGEHVVTPAPAYRHQDVLANLMFQLLRGLETTPQFRTLTSPADVVLGPKTLVQPDIFVLRIDPHRPPESWKEIGVPILAVEILSPGTAARDRGTKRRIYQRAGVGEYWIVDIDARVIERWRQQDGRPEIIEAALEWQPAPEVTVRLSLDDLFPRHEG